MMEIGKLDCAACGAPINVPEGIDHLTCAYCGTSLVVRRGEDGAALKAVEELRKMIEDARRVDPPALSAGVAQVENTGPAVGRKEWRTTTVLCLALGWAGAHRFYSGHILYGVIQFLSFGGFLVWWMIDLYALYKNRYRDASGLALANPGGRLGKSLVFSGIGFLAGLFIGFCTLITLGPPEASASESSMMPAVYLLSLALGALAFVYRYFLRQDSDGLDA